MDNKLHSQQIIEKIRNNELIPVEDIEWICATSTQIFLNEPSVIDVESPVIVVGDVHGQVDAVHYIFHHFGSPENKKYIFLGDYVDRGPKSIYTIVLLLAYKILLEKDFIMIRGNHEDIKISTQYQFRDEIIKTYKSAKLLDNFNSVFTSLPLGVLINNTIFCIHGGLGPAIRSVDTVREIKRPLILSEEDPNYDLVWADPDNRVDDWGNGKRATSCAFGATPLLEFFERSNITGMIRGHECLNEGYRYSFGEDINFVTVFSAPNYTDLRNKAAVLLIDENGKYNFKCFGPFFDKVDFSSNINADKLNKIYYGVAYYDEYMPYDRLKTDMQMIKKAGMNLIRIAESTWSTWEPKEGVFDFTHLHRVLEASKEAGIDVIVGTPTYAIPSWLAKKYPDILCLTHQGQELYGRRQNMDITHPGFLEHAERIIRKLMEEVSKYPHVIGFQIDNETKHYDTCSERVQKMFVDYLKNLYPDIKHFNADFGLNYWSNRVQDWDDFPDVRGTINGSIASEFEHFQRTLVTNYFHWQAKIINELKKPEQFITHNFDLSWRGLSYGYQPDVNQFDASKVLDIPGVDIYHLTEDDLTGIEISLGGDITRSFKRNNYLVLETEAQGLHGWLAYPGQLRLQAFSHIASGAMCVEYWHWHSIHNSFETYWKGVLSHNLKENATFRDCVQIGAEIAKLTDHLLHLKKRNQIAIMLSNRSITSFKYFPAGDIKDQNTILRWIYDALYRMNFEVDMICDNEEELGRYDVIILPSIYSLPKIQIERLCKYVQTGGHLLATFRTAFTNEHVKVYADEQPFGMTNIFGITYDQFTKPGKTSLSSDVLSFEKKPVLSDWMELLIPRRDTEIIARYEHQYWKEYAAVTHRKFGKGSAGYIGCYFDSESLEIVLKKLMSCFGIEQPVEHFPLIRKSGINGKGEEITFYFNYSGEKIEYKAPFEADELIESKNVQAEQTLALDAWSFNILKKVSK